MGLIQVEVERIDIGVPENSGVLCLVFADYERCYRWMCQYSLVT